MGQNSEQISGATHRDGAMHELVGLQWAYKYDISMSHATHFKHTKMNKQIS